MSGAARLDLFASSELRARLQEAGAPGRPLVVTFDGLSADLSLDRPGFGEAWLRQQGFDAVHVTSARNAWYQHADTAPMLEAVRRFAADRGGRLVTYGSSMGGYAAARFAGALGADAAVALSPQWSVDPAAAPWEKRWSEYAAALDFATEAWAASTGGAAQVYVVYDPANRDRLHMEALADWMAVTPLPVRFAGHPAGTFLAETGLLSDAVRAMIESGFDPARFRRDVRAARRRSAAWRASVALRLPPRRSALALRLAEEAAQLAPLTAAYHRALGERRLGAGLTQAAGDAFRRAWSLDPEEPGGRLRLAEHLALHGGEPREVIDLVRGLAGRGAVREWLFVRACDLLVAAGAFREARDEARAASKRLPRSGALRSRAVALTLVLAVPWAGERLLAAARPLLVRRRAGRKVRLVGATGFEPATP